ncbi:hypothetical protein SAMN05216228_100721 [Rhizobium tibeticum]|uniref:Uncharacterized protein n=1 Tax=Rhizobium tibeticum TaxID=501024 RepID=A0A1H8IYM4_9HYPH|nr:hypothetical protein RTCCBAU85039_2027 [Rhizobium tibeticum]SEN73449.1 hypothetical protein SAMN05216228_100721 [Rhizobium tibeticum]
MVRLGLTRVGMYEYGQTAPVDHEPGHKTGELDGQESHLIHCKRVWSDRSIMPATEENGETFGYLLPQQFRSLALLGAVEIDMGMIALNFIKFQG